MYLVDNSLIDLILSRTPSDSVKHYASLAPSMQVYRLPEGPVPTIQIPNVPALRALVGDLVNFPKDAISEETYEYNYDAYPTIRLDEDTAGLLVYHPYKLKGVL